MTQRPLHSCAESASIPRLVRSSYMLPVVPPFRLDLTVSALRRLPTNVIDVLTTDGRYLHAVPGSRLPSIVHVRQASATELEVAIDADPADAAGTGCFGRHAARPGTQRREARHPAPRGGRHPLGDAHFRHARATAERRGGRESAEYQGNRAVDSDCHIAAWVRAARRVPDERFRRRAQHLARHRQRRCRRDTCSRYAQRAEGNAVLSPPPRAAGSEG